MTSHAAKLEEHHPELLRYSEDTRKIINAYQIGGWENADRAIQLIIEESYRRGQLNERGAGLS